MRFSHSSSRSARQAATFRLGYHELPAAVGSLRPVPAYRPEGTRGKRKGRGVLYLRITSYPDSVRQSFMRFTQRRMIGLEHIANSRRSPGPMNELRARSARERGGAAGNKTGDD
ncbi:hypothetical protein EVAR_92552_1 [Eumeta japonica]|uniref:Uncharacterized protein n=1 Tax=Eumeta variegata TaxID=151549 RepID=A0A4C1SXA1_EUMVA|nr:hypothetical protein EVAR_92552_1 [Eumeta japonica]